MDIFVIHAGHDRNLIEAELEKVRNEMGDEDKSKLNAVLLGSDELDWKRTAVKYIKQANLILYVPGMASDPSNIDYELKTAIKYRKVIKVIKPASGVSLSNALKVKDHFTGQEKYYDYEEINYSRIPQIISDYEKSMFGLFNNKDKFDDTENIDVYLEQYKLFAKTSEDLVGRRQNVNNFYVSIQSVLLALMGAMLAMEESSANFPAFAFPVFGCIICVVGFAFSYSWRNILASLGQVNSAKMKVLGILEKQLPLALYDAEWKILDDPMSKKRYKSFTQSESAIPKGFMILYALLGAILGTCILIQIVPRLPEFVQSLKNLFVK